MSSKIEFINKIPMGNRKKSLLIFVLLGSLTLTPILYLCIRDDWLYYQVGNSKLPKISICSSRKIIKNEYVDCVFEVDNEAIEAKIKIRGSRIATNLSKKGYRLELLNQKSFFGMREDDDWLLFPMYQDQAYMKYKLGFELWRSLLDTDPTAILPDSRYVNLFINNKYQGLYLFSEKNDRRLFGLDDAQDDIKSSLIFLAHEGGTRTKRSFEEYNEDQWEQKWPNIHEGIDIKDDIFNELIPCINDPPDEIFFNESIGIYTIFDKKNLIDFYIFNFFILHNDFWKNNYFLVRNSYPSKYFLIPWDFDSSFGQSWKNKFHDFSENPESEIQKLNKLYSRLLDNEEFIDETKNRWMELREDLWTENHILDMLTGFYEKIKDIVEIDYQMWHDSGEAETYINALFEFIPERLEYCDSYFAL